MATPIQMPALSPTMKEGKITKWLKKEGDSISSGQAIAECETDKSNLEIEAYEDGVLLKILVAEGESAPVGQPIGFIGAKGEKVEDLPKAAPAPAPAAPRVAAPTPAPPPARTQGNGHGAPTQSPTRPPTKAPAAPARGAPAQARAASSGQLLQLRPPPVAQGSVSADARLRASPLAKKMAREQGLDLAVMQGSGPAGRIIKRDVEQAMSTGVSPGRGAPAMVPVTSFERHEPQQLAITSMRKIIAQRMSEVKPGVPHFYLTVEVEMDAALKIREEAKALDTKLSVNDILVKAAAIALRRVPRMNVAWGGDHIVQFSAADVGIAVAIEDGLITPVVRDADQKGLAALAAEARSLAERARKRALKPDEYTGGSITVSNLGMFGIDSFIGVINSPQAAILAVGSVAERPVARDGQVVVRQMMSVTLSGDHRVIDGALGAQYLSELKALLEHPMRLMF